MRLKFILYVLALCVATFSFAQSADSIHQQTIDEVVVMGNIQKREQQTNPLSIAIVEKEDIARNFSGNVMKSLEYIPGVQSMSVGSGFSKPMIRGMGFNRVSVIEGGIKQEGQQWGADHGLEIDAFNVERVNIRKGSSSLLFGSDAMGGVVEILQPVLPSSDGVFGEVDLIGRSVNGLLGGSLMMGLKKGRWFVKARHSEQHFADFAVPTDHVVYLTQIMPITDGRVNNTAGFERSSSLYTRYGGSNFTSAISLSNAYQKAGFYPGAHGVPDPSRVYDDGNLRNIDLPYSTVNHLKILSLNKYWWSGGWVSWDLGYQNNHREEHSEFHTHYSTQTIPEVDPDLEILLALQNFSSDAKVHIDHSYRLSSEVAWSAAYQDNQIGGYSFLIPAYRRFTTGVAYVANFEVSDAFRLSGGVRYDFGNISVDEYQDEYLVDYLYSQGYNESVVEANEMRSYNLDRNFGDYSLSLGGVWSVNTQNRLRANIGRSFRLPNANELVANGVHHSSFRHEQGDPTLDSERGWQADLGYEYSNDILSISLSPYVSWYASYIYLQPTLEWSVLPHAGQIYRYTQCEALFAGGEAAFSVNLSKQWQYKASVEYTYSCNIDERISITFTPPTTLRNEISWHKELFSLSAEWKMVADQNNVGRNEDPTPGANLFGFRAVVALPFISEGTTMVASVDNIFNTKYLNHLSYYRYVEIPEEGRNFQLSIKIPFKIN
ncbi:MAG: TonB-dependent receptor [Rikenellaceae bacterium]